MRTALRALCILTVCFCLFIIAKNWLAIGEKENVLEQMKQYEKANPVGTFFLGIPLSDQQQAILEKDSYTFWFPLSSYEIRIYVMLFVGLAGALVLSPTKATSANSGSENPIA